MKKFILISLLVIFPSLYVYCFDGLMFRPLTANVFEPRTGALYEFSSEKLRLDIGTSLDMLSFNLDEKSELRIGADFFTYTRLRTAGNFKFPVETSDYYFGVNSSILTKSENYTLSGRLRVAHISSHLVDGMATDSIFNRIPFVYSREFVDAIAAISFDNLRFYLGFTYVFSTIPNNVNKIVPDIGFDYSYPINDLFTFNMGYDFKLNGNNEIYSGVNSFQTGILINTSKNVGIQINYYLYDGLSMHGMYYFERDSYSGLGFQLIFYNIL